MPRAHTFPDSADMARDAGAGEWQALRGELVALLDKVESHYGQIEDEPPAPPASALAQRVRNLRDQVTGSEASTRRREALQTVKRAVDRFTERDTSPVGAEEPDDLTAAIAEIRSRQGAAPMPAPMRRATDMPEIRELGVLVGTMSQRLERLEGELKSQRSSAGHVREVASQVEQLTQVVELLAGAVGETGQVKRLEAQIAALGAMIEEGPRNDLSILNARLDDVSTTVGKLAELQAQQMEREIARDQRRAAESKPDPAQTLAPAMRSIEDGVRNVYDRIDAIEQTVSLSAADFERLTSEMAAFTRAIQDKDGRPDALAAQLDAVVARLDRAENGNEQIAALKAEMGALRDTVLEGLEPRFARLENKLETLSDRIVPVDTKAVEDQLKLLMGRMDDASAQLDTLARQQGSTEQPDFESLATMVAERTSDAMSRKAPAPVAMFGPDSLKSIEDRLAGMIKSAGKTPDYEQLADMVATRASEALSKGPAISSDNIDALEKRMTALLNTTGKETAERLARLEAVLAGASEKPVAPAKPPAPAAALASAPTPSISTPAADAADPEDEFAQVLQAAAQPDNRKLDTILAGLTTDRRDAMPSNPADEAPLVDKGFPDKTPVRSALSGEASRAAAPMSQPQPTKPAPPFDPSKAERPPRPRSSFAELDADPFAPAAPSEASKSAEAPVAPSNTSTFVAAARRAQRAKQEEAPAGQGNSIIGRALARVRSRKENDAAASPVLRQEEPKDASAPQPEPRRKREKPAKAEKRTQAKRDDNQAPPLPEAGETPQASFLARHRRPLLLAATLAAVSMLALNLVLQRMSPPAPGPDAAVTAPADPASDTPPASDDVSSLVPPRVIDLVDTTATGSINPGEPMSFSRAGKLAPSTPMPPTLMADGGRIALAVPTIEDAPEVTGSIGANAAAAPVESFDLPPEAVGPLELRQAAANGNAKAQFEVAAIFGEGRALEKDLEASARWYERSASQGFAPAQYRLGNLYELGNGVEKNLEQARLWYQRSAEAGNRMAMHNLAALYAGGEMGDQQFEQAAEWFTQAANRGMTDSQFNLGMLYARGLGVEQDFEQSYKWFSLAAANGDQDAAKARDDIAKSLSAEAVGRLGAELAAWRMEKVDLAANFAPIGTWTDTFDPGEPIGNGEVIAKVQQALSKLGFDVGTADGVVGPKTRDAIRAFERATGMSESGSINPRLLAVLGSQPV